MSRLLILAACLVGMSAHANLAQTLIKSTHPFLRAMAVNPMARFTVGDTANYDLSLASISGTMVMKVTAVDSTSVTIDQAANIMGQAQDIVEVIDPNTGAIKSVTVNGQKQTPPDPNDIQIISINLATITVKAGTFKCQDVKLHMKQENSDAEQWADMNDVPVGGMLKMTTTEQGMPVTLELTSFSRGH